jgi:hypothetical protein
MLLNPVIEKLARNLHGQLRTDKLPGYDRLEPRFEAEACNLFLDSVEALDPDTLRVRVNLILKVLINRACGNRWLCGHILAKRETGYERVVHKSANSAETLEFEPKTTKRNLST